MMTIDRTFKPFRQLIVEQSTRNERWLERIKRKPSKFDPREMPDTVYVYRELLREEVFYRQSPALQEKLVELENIKETVPSRVFMHAILDPEKRKPSRLLNIEQSTLNERWLETIQRNPSKFDPREMPDTVYVYRELLREEAFARQSRALKGKLVEELKDIKETVPSRVFMHAILDPEKRGDLQDRNYERVLLWAEQVLCELPYTNNLVPYDCFKTEGGQKALNSLTDEQKSIIWGDLQDINYERVLLWAEQVLCELPYTNNLVPYDCFKTEGGQKALNSLTDEQKSIICEDLNVQVVSLDDEIKKVDKKIKAITSYGNMLFITLLSMLSITLLVVGVLAALNAAPPLVALAPFVTELLWVGGLGSMFSVGLMLSNTAEYRANRELRDLLAGRKAFFTQLLHDPELDPTQNTPELRSGQHEGVEIAPASKRGQMLGQESDSTAAHMQGAKQRRQELQETMTSAVGKGQDPHQSSGPSGRTFDVQ